MSSNLVPCPDAFWLDGCSWGCGYYSGLMQGMLDRWGPEIYEKRWGGASAGALFALGMALGKPMDEFTTLYRQFARQGTQYGVFLKMSVYHDAVLRRWLFTSESEPIDINPLNGKLFVGITAFPCELVLKSSFVDVYDLMDTLHASFHIPWYCSHIEPLLPPAMSNDEQVSRERVPERDVPVGERRKRWFVDGGIARNCDLKLCCPGVTLNVSPVLQNKITALECIFPMSMERFAEMEKSSRQDILDFTAEEQFDLSPTVGGGQAPVDGGSGQMSRTLSVASFSLSRSNSATDLNRSNSATDLKKKPGGLTVSNSYNRLCELASTAVSKLQRKGSHSMVLAPSPLQRWWLTVMHSPALSAARYALALTLWANRVLEYAVYRRGGEVTVCFVLAYLLKRIASKGKSLRSYN